MRWRDPQLAIKARASYVELYNGDVTSSQLAPAISLAHKALGR